ncbi:hypothetical protein SAMN04488542_12649 [Fontibacillus panacisegetis]|uniref:Uncharacterized protein n=1 Tax=Fontibacillus panacisegetis TaxID=670482 RepID=A0A1G7RMB2_9BACL|nr:hypothetical protein [Fontibacillus panacisegetis]SDG11359.1 hypothetical protein SAMN04488542_12649 [Fontibacillus panacisegetis]
MHQSRTFFIGTIPNVLEPKSLELSSFGALWYEEDNQRYIIGYGFGARQIAKLTLFCNSPAYVTCNDERLINEIYKSIREKQHAQDWSTRKRLPLMTAFKEPWKSMNRGWYILRSRSFFPLHLSIVQRTKHSVWLEHTAVCENEAELANYLTKAEEAHQLRLLEYYRFN